MNIRELNRHAWDMLAEGGNEWTVPVAPEVISRAKKGDWSVLLTESTPTPRDWFPAEMKDVEILGLAASGGQQGPVLAAAGATVTVFDNSPRQLERDRRVAEREGLAIKIVEGDMADLSVFPDASFDLVFHPVSNCFIPDPRPVWRECFRVLRPGGALLAGFLNPLLFLFDAEAEERGELTVKYRLPYADTTHLSEKELHARLDGHQPLEFGHSLDAQLGGQLAAGFHLVGLFEDRRRGGVLAEHTPLYLATRAVKPR